MLGSKDLTAADLARFNVFENYLRICIGALSDPERPAVALREFTTRRDMPKDLIQEVESWLDALGQVDFEKSKSEKLGTGRFLIENAADKTQSRSDRSQLVGFVVGITLLHRYLDSQPTRDVDIAEAHTSQHVGRHIGVVVLVGVDDLVLDVRPLQHPDHRGQLHEVGSGTDH